MTSDEVVRALHGALESGEHGESLRQYFTEDAVTIERPNVLKPNGARATLDEMVAASTQGAGLLESQKYDVISITVSAGTVALRCTWTGVIAIDLGPLKSGQVLTAHIAQFVEVRDGRIASIDTYDCYEPLAP